MKQLQNPLRQQTLIKNENKPKCVSLALFFTLLTLSLGSAHAQIISTVVGNGTEGYNDAVPATAGQITAVSHVSVDNSGNLYFPGQGFKGFAAGHRKDVLGLFCFVIIYYKNCLLYTSPSPRD